MEILQKLTQQNLWNPQYLKKKSGLVIGGFNAEIGYIWDGWKAWVPMMQDI